MSHGPTSTPSKGCCIYCRDTSVFLSREHIVPLSLGGQHVIEKASCAACAKITQRFEQDVARGLWGDARVSVDAPSRRKKDRPTQIEVGHPRRVRVSYKEYPPSFVFYKMLVPGILQGKEPDIDLSGDGQMIVISDDAKLNKFRARHNTNITMSFRHVPLSFSRLIAKIGYGHILTQLDLDDFEPLVVPYILGTKANVSYVVGCKDEMEPPIEGTGYHLSTLISGLAEQAFIIAGVRLLANCHTPTYSVVVGRTRNINSTQQVLDKLSKLQ